MAIDWKTIISEFDGKPTLLQAIGKLRKAVEEETMTIQQAQAEIAKLESQQKIDEALINTKQDKLNNKSDVTVLYLTATNGINAGSVKTGEVSDDEDNIYNFPKKPGTFALTEDVTAVGTKAQNALGLATTNETDIATLDGQVAEIEKNKWGLLGGVELLENADLNNYREPGNYYCSSNSTALTIINSPSKNAFIMKSFYGQGTTYPKQLLFEFNNNHFYSRWYSNESWQPWEKIALFSDIAEQSFKTIFGNQSITGTGNIDLYKHTVVITGTSPSGWYCNDPVFIQFYSSNNVKCASLTDLKTILGNTFYIDVKGAGITKNDESDTRMPRYMNETSLFAFNGVGTSVQLTLAGFTFTDTVTTI